jgi:hypothetical protein
MSGVWQTKYGSRRVRYDPPTLDEAIVAAQGLTNQVQQQAEIAAALMNVPVEAVRTELLKRMPPRGAGKIVTSSGREGVQRTIIVERKSNRRLSLGARAARS